MCVVGRAPADADADADAQAPLGCRRGYSVAAVLLGTIAARLRLLSALVSVPFISWFWPLVSVGLQRLFVCFDRACCECVTATPASRLLFAAAN